MVERPDPSIVEKTYQEHPLPQCRLDTYFQGAICDEDPERNLSAEDETVGTWHSINKHTEGLRPLCWFRPRE